MFHYVNMENTQKHEQYLWWYKHLLERMKAMKPSIMLQNQNTKQDNHRYSEGLGGAICCLLSVTSSLSNLFSCTFCFKLLIGILTEWFSFTSGFSVLWILVTYLLVLSLPCLLCPTWCFILLLWTSGTGVVCLLWSLLKCVNGSRDSYSFKVVKYVGELALLCLR